MRTLSPPREGRAEGSQAANVTAVRSVVRDAWSVSEARLLTDSLGPAGRSSDLLTSVGIVRYVINGPARGHLARVDRDGRTSGRRRGLQRRRKLDQRAEGVAHERDALALRLVLRRGQRNAARLQGPGV